LKVGFAPQLPLEAVIAVKGGFSLLPASDVSELSYWQLSGGEPAGKITFFNEAKKVDVMQETQKAYDGLAKLVTTFDLPKTPYLNKPRPESVGYGEYDHLARTKEWGDG
ncbi:MAG: double-strand break repair protein AddB, partial [Kordiimonadaceae bacterium]|nr:double-strand break repair protein AddB [Kordiimonadaceae bacterium]